MEYRATNALGPDGHRIHRSPSTLSEQIGTLQRGCTIQVILVNGNWGKIIDDAGWIMLSDPSTGEVFFKPATSDVPISLRQSTTGSSRTIESLDYIVYRTTSNVLSGGIRVRRQPTLQADHIGTVSQGAANIRITYCITKTNNEHWGKLHPSMSTLIDGLNYQPNSINQSDGWILIHKDDETLFEPVETINPPVYLTSSLFPAFSTHFPEATPISEASHDTNYTARLVVANSGVIISTDHHILSSPSRQTIPIVNESHQDIMGLANGLPSHPPSITTSIKSLITSIQATTSLKELKDIEDIVLSEISKRKVRLIF